MRLGAHRVDVRSDHQPCEGGGRLDGGVDVGRDLAETKDRRVVTELLHLLEPVRDVEHRATVVGQPAQRHEELVGFLRGEDRGRLVHDEEAGLLEEAAHDLDALAFADREVRDERGRLQGQAVLRRDPRDALAERSEVEPSWHRERDVLHHREGFEEGEVLEHHADPESPGRRGVCDRHRLAAPAKLSGGGLEGAVDDLDQGRLPGPVLAEEGVDPSRAKPHGHPIVGREVAEALHDVAGLEEELLLRGRLRRGRRVAGVGGRGRGRGRG